MINKISNSDNSRLLHYYGASVLWCVTQSPIADLWPSSEAGVANKAFLPADECILNLIGFVVVPFHCGICGK